MALAANHDLHRLRHLDAHVLRNPAVENIRRTDAKSDAANRTHVRRVRVRANVDLSRQRVAFQHYRVADALRPLAIFQLSVEFDPLLRREVLLFELELCCQIEQAKLLFLLRNDFIEKREVVAEKDNA